MFNLYASTDQLVSPNIISSICEEVVPTSPAEGTRLRDTPTACRISLNASILIKYSPHVAKKDLNPKIKCVVLTLIFHVGFLLLIFQTQVLVETWLRINLDQYMHLRFSFSEPRPCSVTRVADVWSEGLT